MSAVIGLFLSPLEATRVTGPGPLGRLVETYRWAVHFKANPRSRSYMEALLLEHWPDAVMVAVEDAGWRADIAGASTVVLLYPDAIGLGFGAFERAVLGALPVDADVQVLNGRRRRLALTPRVRRSLRARRALERSMLSEVLATPVVVAAGLVLAGADHLRGRR